MVNTKYFRSEMEISKLLSGLGCNGARDMLDLEVICQNEMKTFCSY